MWCPSYGKNVGQSQLELVAFCRNNKCTIGKDNMGLKCPHPFKDQIIRVTVYPGVPFSLQPAAFGRPLAGFHIQVARIISEKIGFSIKFKMEAAGTFFPGNKTFGPGFFENLRTGNIELAGSGTGFVAGLMFDLGFPLAQTRIVGVSRAPKPKLSFGNILKPFPTSIWLVFCISLLALSTMLLATYKIYTNVSIKHIFKHDTYENFFLFTFCKITEPEPLPWFRGGMAGQLSVLLWTLLSLFLILFYVSNLRAVMVTTEYEKPIDSLQDIVRNDQRVWIERAYMQYR